MLLTALVARAEKTTNGQRLFAMALIVLLESRLLGNRENAGNLLGTDWLCR